MGADEVIDYRQGDVLAEVMRLTKGSTSMNAWFQAGQSFPSGEVRLQVSFVTPFIVHYGRRYPAVWALVLLTLYEGIARMKSHAHWQTDVLGGWALGTAVGYLTTTWETPVSVMILPHGLAIGLSKRF
ncbi:phosphatase PAP2 family protein [Paraburkholderia xenovorans]|uniref:phosphatase PAP2 family protein n=1 Tax=Paraburkholderia xenovorans TaxID=36873 RepID=UPI0038BBB3A0